MSATQRNQSCDLFWTGGLEKHQVGGQAQVSIVKEALRPEPPKSSPPKIYPVGVEVVELRLVANDPQMGSLPLAAAQKVFSPLVQLSTAYSFPVDLTLDLLPEPFSFR